MSVRGPPNKHACIARTRGNARLDPRPLPQIDISEGGTINASALKKITAGGDGLGLRTYDPG